MIIGNKNRKCVTDPKSASALGLVGSSQQIYQILGGIASDFNLFSSNICFLLYSSLLSNVNLTYLSPNSNKGAGVCVCVSRTRFYDFSVPRILSVCIYVPFPRSADDVDYKNVFFSSGFQNFRHSRDKRSLYS